MAKQEDAKKLAQDSNALLVKMSDIFMGQEMNAVFTALIRATANVTANSPDPKAIEYAVEALKDSHEKQKKKIQKAN